MKFLNLIVMILEWAHPRIWGVGKFWSFSDYWILIFCFTNSYPAWGSCSDIRWWKKLLTCFLRSIHSMLHFCLCLFSPISMILLLQMAEYRISIYGRKQSEWDQLASWIVNNELYSENVVWLIQVLTVSKSLLLKFIFIWSLKGKVG